MPTLAQPVFYQKPPKKFTVNVTAGLEKIIGPCRREGFGMMVALIDLNSLYYHFAVCQEVMENMRDTDPNKLIFWGIVANEEDTKILDKKLDWVFAQDKQCHAHEQLIYNRGGEEGLEYFEITDHLSHRFDNGEVFRCTLCLKKGGALLEEVDLDEGQQATTHKTPKVRG